MAPGDESPRVGSAVLAAAGAFVLEESVAWAYVSLLLGRRRSGGAATIAVQAGGSGRTISISTGDIGLSGEEIAAIFEPCAESQDRWDPRQGRAEPSQWATAAFGVADRLSIESVQAGLAHHVEVTRATLVRTVGAAVPLRWLGRDQPTTRPPCTVVTIDEIAASDLDASRIASYLERRLATCRGARPHVSVNGHACRGDLPAVAFTRTCRPSPEQAAVLGDITLHLGLAQSPLPSSRRGILVLGALGNLLGVFLDGTGCEHVAQHLFGEVTVPCLDLAPSVAGRGADRTLQLDPGHPVASALTAFLRAKVREIAGQVAGLDQTAAWYRRLVHA